MRRHVENCGSNLMILMLVILSVLLGSTTATVSAVEMGQSVYDMNTTLMETTFRIEGLNKDKRPTLGTAFLVTKSIPDNPGLARYVLVTAAHVIEKMVDDFATLHLRTKTEANEWLRVPFRLQIRRNGQALWTKHPKADVAVMYVALPAHTLDSIPKFLGASLLADDNMLREYELHPGDTLYCLGYPLGQESNAEGFPILRSGKIASYPLLPTKKTKKFLFDFPVFFGNSGGPVYFVDSNRIYNKIFHVGQVTQILVGLVSQLRYHPQEVEELFSKRTQMYPLGLAEVVHASLIKETIALLP